MPRTASSSMSSACARASSNVSPCVAPGMSGKMTTYPPSSSCSRSTGYASAIFPSIGTPSQFSPLNSALSIQIVEPQIQIARDLEQCAAAYLAAAGRHDRLAVAEPDHDMPALAASPIDRRAEAPELSLQFSAGHADGYTPMYIKRNIGRREQAMLVVTGGGGFIGSVLTARLNEAGYQDIVIVDRFGTSEKWRNIAKRDFCEIVAIDRLMDWLERFGGAVAAVFHLGAISSTTFADADQVIATNLNYSIALWRWCAEAQKRLVYASSAATYGDGAAGFDDHGGVAELKRLRPMNLYGWSKHAFDLYALREAAAGRAPPFWAGLKFFNVFGPNEYHKGDMMSLVAKNYRRIVAGDSVPLFKSYRPDIADGEQCRDFVSVKDCAEVMLWLLQQGRDCGLYNLGSG